MNIFKNVLSEVSVKLCFSVTFNIIISYIFSKKIHKNSSSLSEDMNFYFFGFTYFCHFLDSFTFTCYKKTNDISIYMYVIVLRIVLSYINKWISSTSNMKVEGHTDPHRIIIFNNPTLVP